MVGISHEEVVAVGAEDGVEGVSQGHSVPAFFFGQHCEVDPAVVVVDHHVLVGGSEGREGESLGVVVDLGVAVGERLYLDFISLFGEDFVG